MSRARNDDVETDGPQTDGPQTDGPQTDGPQSGGPADVAPAGDDFEMGRVFEMGRLAELGLMFSEFVHEVRQPLFALKAQAEILRGRGNPADSELIDGLVSQARLLEELLARYAASGRRINGMVQPVQLSTAVRAGVEILRHRARHGNKTLDLEVGPEARPVRGDPVALQQITTNLVANALDAAHSRVSVVTSDGRLVVTDDGDGISQDVRDHMFEPFYTTKPCGKGTGLGLTITRRLVERSGGRLHLDSGDGGTRFVVDFAPWSEE